MSSYNITRFTRQILKRHRKQPPSIIVHLYPTHFRFEHQHGNYNYDSPMKCFLEAIREQKLPTDLLDVLDQAKVRYYNGCLIVEVHDHRSAPPTPASLASRNQLSFGLAHTRDQPSTSKAEVYRIVLGPNPATLWTELGIMNERVMSGSSAINVENEDVDNEGWTEEEAVELEAMILARTAPPLCLSPSLQTNRVANIMLRATTLRPPKRRRTNEKDSAEQEAENLLRKAREEHERVMKIGDEGLGRSRGNAFSRLAFIQSYRERGNPGMPPPPVAVAPSVPTSIRLYASVSGVGSRTQVRAASPTTSDKGRAVARLKKTKYFAETADGSIGGGTPGSVASGSGTGKKSKKSKLARADSPDGPEDPGEKERKKKAAALKKSKSKLEKKRKEAEAAQAGGNAAGPSGGVIWSNGKPVNQ